MKYRHALAGVASGALLVIGVGAGGAAAQTVASPGGTVVGADGGTTTPLSVASEPWSPTASSQATSSPAVVSPAFDSNTYYFTNGYKCLDADSGTLHAKSTKVQMWDCEYPQDQHWIFHAVPGKAYVYTITNVGADNKCLDADTGTIGHNGTIVHLYPCDSWVGQQWYIWGRENGDILYLQNEASGRYLDAATERAGQNGDPVQLWDYSGGPSQEWGTPEP